MTISSTNRKAGPYAGNDVAVSFPFAFKVFVASDLYVVRADSDGAETVLALTANYTVTLNSDQNANPGGTITLPAALADGLTLTITSTLPYLQPVDLTNNGGFYPKVINSALDRLTIFVQQIASEIGASLKLGSNDTPGSGAYRAGGNRISDVGNPTSPGDAVNRGWLDLAITGVNTYTNSLHSQARRYAESLVSGVVGGYGYFIQLAAGAISRTFQDKMRESVSVLDFGAVGDGVTDDTAVIELIRASGTGFNIPSGNYLVNVFRTLPNKTYIGFDYPTISYHFVSATAWLAFQTNSKYEGIIFESTEANLPYQRGAIEDVNNVVIRDCKFIGFRDADPLPDAWGLLIQRASNVVLDNLEFADNSQSDIAMTDNVRDVTIIGASNPTDGGVYLNIEPNAGNGVVGLNVIGGHYRLITLNENYNTAYASTNLVFNGCRVDSLHYDGSGASFVNCKIDSLTNAPDGLGSVYAGNLTLDNASLGVNLFSDPYLMSLDSSNVSATWTVYSTGGTRGRVSDGDGKYMRFNSGKGAVVQSAYQRTDIAVTPLETLIFACRARVDNTSIAGVGISVVTVSWRTAGDVEISLTGIKCCRTAVSTNSGWHTDVAVLIPPATAAKARIYIGSPANNTSADISAVGLFRPKFNVANGNWSNVIGDLSSARSTTTFYQPNIPSSANCAGYFVGERCINSVPTVGQPKSWVCTVAGTPGTWVSEGNL